MFLRRRRLEVELLESRLTPSSFESALVDSSPPAEDSQADYSYDYSTSASTTTTDSTSSDTSASADGSIPPSDPTEQPVDSSNTTVLVQVAAVGDSTDGLSFTLTVDGLQPENVQAFSSMTFTLGQTSYAVDQVTALDNGQYRLTVLGGFECNAIEVGSSLQLVIGNGGNDGGTTTADPPPEEQPTEPPPTVPPVDPTETPVGSE